jgi:hypothetical protein
LLKSRVALQLENVALRHQIEIARLAIRSPVSNATDRTDACSV